jgi:hypothetical protein
MKRTILVIALLLLSAGFGFSLDFGLLADEKFEAENESIASTTGFAPWLSWDNGEGLSLYFSGVVSLWYSKSDDGDSENDGLGKPALLPELSRFALSYRINKNMSLEAGRVFYADALGVTASGLFDGARFEAAVGPGAFSAGVYYTGLLYKETAKIVMTTADKNNYGDPRNLDEFFDDYFASRRVFGAARWDMPLGEEHSLSFEALAQFDLNGNDPSGNKPDRLHSQYGEARLELFSFGEIGVTAGAFFEAMEMEGDIGGNDFGMAFGALGAVRIDLPTPFNDGVKFTTKFSSGAWNDSFAAFTPLSAHSQGQVFAEPFSGMWVNKLNYEARLLPSLFAEAAFGYYARTYSQEGAGGNLYGGEAWAALAWQPFDDVRVNAGGGAFFPAMGNAKYNDGKVMWKVSAGLTLSL